MTAQALPHRIRCAGTESPAPGIGRPHREPHTPLERTALHQATDLAGIYFAVQASYEQQLACKHSRQKNGYRWWQTGSASCSGRSPTRPGGRS
jgi:hypothetical protein